MKKSDVSTNIKWYYLFQLFKEPLFWGPILITYISSVSGMKLSEIYFMESICLVLLVILEIPSGALSDLLGRRLTIILGSFLFVIDNLIFSLSSGPAMIWAANLIWVIGYSLISGSDSSLLYDSLLSLGREDEFKKINGRSMAYRFGLVAVCSIFVGYLADINLRLPLFLGWIFIFFNFFVTLMFKEPPRISQKKYSIKKHIDLMKNSSIFVLRHSKIKWMIGFVVLIGAVSKVWFFAYNPYFELVELPIIYFGWLFFMLNMVCCISSYFSHSIAQKFGDLGSIILMSSLIALPVFIMGTWVSQTSCLLILFANITRGYLTPFVDHFLHYHIDSSHRATIISIKSAANGLAQFIMLALFGVLLNMYSLPFCFQLMGVIMIVGCLVFVGTYLKIFKNSR